MKFFLFTALAILGIHYTYGQECKGRYIKIINKNEAFSIPCDQMFLLNAETFGRFYYASNQMDSLVLLIPEQKKISDSLYKVNQEQLLILNKEIKLQEKQLDDRMAGIKRLESIVKISIDNNEDCIKKFSHLAEQYRKEERRKKRWRAATGVLSGVSVILIALLVI